MELNEYQHTVQNFAFYPHDMGPYYTTFGMMDVVGQLAKKLKKALHDTDGEIDLKTKQLMTVQLGDLLYFISNTATDLGVSMNDIATYNIRKLSSAKEQKIMAEYKQNNNIK